MESSLPDDSRGTCLPSGPALPAWPPHAPESRRSTVNTILVSLNICRWLPVLSWIKSAFRGAVHSAAPPSLSGYDDGYFHALSRCLQPIPDHTEPTTRICSITRCLCTPRPSWLNAAPPSDLTNRSLLSVVLMGSLQIFLTTELIALVSSLIQQFVDRSLHSGMNNWSRDSSIHLLP